METTQIITSNSPRIENAINFLAPNAETINKRLQVIEKEWDLDRVYEMNEDVAQLSGSLLGKIINRQYNSLPVLTTTFLAQETTPYWNPPVALFKSLGYRAKAEIENEKKTLITLLNNADSEFNFSEAAVA
ncbi:MAG: hypothetical protein H7329_09390 [Opitutaceae bacterium]|nr:hypothetical protein [Cytophagales bacterium]